MRQSQALLKVLSMVWVLNLRPEFCCLAMREKAAKEGFPSCIPTHQLRTRGHIRFGVVVNRSGHSRFYPCFAFITSQGVGPLRHSQVASSWSK